MMEEWKPENRKDGRLEGWKAKDGMMDEWNDGGWTAKNGNELEYWKNGMMGDG